MINFFESLKKITKSVAVVFRWRCRCVCVRERLRLCLSNKFQSVWNIFVVGFILLPVGLRIDCLHFQHCCPPFFSLFSFFFCIENSVFLSTHFFDFFSRSARSLLCLLAVWLLFWPALMRIRKEQKKTEGWKVTSINKFVTSCWFLLLLVSLPPSLSLSRSLFLVASVLVQGVNPLVHKKNQRNETNSLNKDQFRMRRLITHLSLLILNPSSSSTRWSSN